MWHVVHSFIFYLLYLIVDMNPVQSSSQPECLSNEYQALAVGCSGSHEQMEFKSPCVQQPIIGKHS